MTKKSFFYTILTLFLVATSATLLPNFSYSQLEQDIDKLKDKIEKKREKIDDIEESIQKYQNKAESKRREAVSLSNQMDIIENNISQTELEIEKVEKRVESLNLRIKSLNKDIKQKEQDIKRQKEMIGELVKTLHQKGRHQFVEVLAAYDNFSEFYNKLQQLESVERDLAESTKALKQNKTELQREKKQKEKMKQEFESQKDKLENKKQDLKEQKELKERVLERVQRSELKYKTLVNNLRSKFQQIERDIRNIEQKVRKKVERKKELRDRIEGDPTTLSWPTQSRYITAEFHDEDYPFKHIMEHKGIDIRAAQGTEVHASAAGYVARAKRCQTSSCYSFVMVVHSNGISTVYSHLSKVSVSENEFVTRGQKIGLSGGMPGTPGSGPWSTGPHLHMEVRKDGIPTDPMDYLIKDY
ncbi:MAG: murein hydrolase activator EnvC [Candidatus Paceibacteria bacterium]